MEQASSNALLATFTAEEAVFQEAGTYDAQKVMRIRDLEEMLLEYKASHDELQRQLENATGGEQSAPVDQKPLNGNGTPSAEVELAITKEREVHKQTEKGLFVQVYISVFSEYWHLP